MESNGQNKFNNGAEYSVIQRILNAVRYRKKVKRFSWLKPKMSVEQFCGNLYENCIFYSTCGYAEDMRLILWSEIYDSIVKIDNNFQHIELDVFTREMTALQVELFGLAWMHNFMLDQYHGLEEKYTFGEIMFTKNYMKQHGYGEIWNIMSYHYCPVKVLENRCKANRFNRL